MISIGNKLQYVVQTMTTNYVDYRVYILNPTSTLIYTGRCYKTPNQTYGIIDVTEILQGYCNLNEIFNNETYFTGTTHNLMYPVIKFTISTKKPNDLTYTELVSSEELLYSYQNYYYNDIPTNDLVPNVLQQHRTYYVNKSAIIPYDIVRKYFDVYFGVRIYWRPDGNDLLLHSYTIDKEKLNHFSFPLLETVTNYVEVWAVSYTNGGVETLIPNSKVTYHYTKPYCSKNEYVVYWINRYGGLEIKCVDGKTIKKISSIPSDFNTYERYNVNGAAISKNKIAFSNQRNQVIEKYQYECNFHYNLIDDEEWEYMETLFSSPYVWLYDIENQTYIPVIVKDNEYSFDYYRNNRKQLPSYKITFESSNKNLRR